MSIQTAVQELKSERVRIDRALAALETSAPAPTPAPSTGTRKPAASASASSGGGRRTFTMSPEAKQKIAKAQKERWAKIKKGMKAA